MAGKETKGVRVKVEVILEGHGVSKYFGALKALDNVNFQVKKGTIFGVIGPNGAGKTTLFNCIAGVYHPDEGTIKFNGTEISMLPPYKICKMGIARTFQLVKPFKRLRVLENVLPAVISGRANIRELSTAREEAVKILEFCNLLGKKDAIAGSLGLADLRRLEIARALATRPELILLDESFAGLNPGELREACELVRRIRSEFGITIILIEHVMKIIEELAEVVMVLHHGCKISEGPPKKIAEDQRVIEAYLGTYPVG